MIIIKKERTLNGGTRKFKQLLLTSELKNKTIIYNSGILTKLEKRIRVAVPWSNEV